jgi:hypothetical protein
LPRTYSDGPAGRPSVEIRQIFGDDFAGVRLAIAIRTCEWQRGGSPATDRASPNIGREQIMQRWMLVTGKAWSMIDMWPTH